MDAANFPEIGARSDVNRTKIFLARHRNVLYVRTSRIWPAAARTHDAASPVFFRNHYQYSFVYSKKVGFATYAWESSHFMYYGDAALPYSYCRPYYITLVKSTIDDRRLSCILGTYSTIIKK